MIIDYGFKSVTDFAKIYKGTKGKRKGVSTVYLSALINKEIATPGTTGLDVQVCGKVRLVRYQQ